MISSKKELNEYLAADKRALGRQRNSPQYKDLIWRYEISLRKSEYYGNSNGIISRVLYKYHSAMKFYLGVLCGFEIPNNCFGKGLSIAHKGTIVVNGNTKVGENCRIHTCVNIGTYPGSGTLAPMIGDNVYIAPGVKVYGNIVIGSNVMIGANSVVTKSWPEDGICIAGAPAKKISDLGRTEIEEKYQTFEKSLNKKNI